MLVLMMIRFVCIFLFFICGFFLGCVLQVWFELYVQGFLNLCYQGVGVVVYFGVQLGQVFFVVGGLFVDFVEQFLVDVEMCMYWVFVWVDEFDVGCFVLDYVVVVQVFYQYQYEEWVGYCVEVVVELGVYIVVIELVQVYVYLNFVEIVSDVLYMDVCFQEGWVEIYGEVQQVGFVCF